MEAESPPVSRRRIGGPQPTIEHSPKLFDKAKRYLEKYPDKIDDSDDEETKLKKKKEADKRWLQTQDPDVADKSGSVTPIPR